MSAHLVQIPSEDLTRQYQQIRWEVAAIDSVLPGGKYTQGPIEDEEVEAVAGAVRQFLSGGGR